MDSIKDLIDVGMTLEDAKAHQLAMSKGKGKPEADRRPATKAQYWFYFRALVNAKLTGSTKKESLKGINLPDELFKAMREYYEGNCPDALEAAQKPAPVANPKETTGTCTWVLLKGKNQGNLCGDTSKLEIDGAPRCGTHALKEVEKDVTAKVLNESVDGENTVQSANVNAPKVKEAQAPLIENLL